MARPGPKDAAADPILSLAKGQQAVVEAVVKQFRSELIETFPELNLGVQTSAASGSFSATLSIVKARKNRFSGKLKCRIRTPREPLEIDMHLDEDQQLSFGAPTEGWEDDDSDVGGFE